MANLAQQCSQKWNENCDLFKQWKGMLFRCEQPFLWGERCVTSQKMAVKETTYHRAPPNLLVSFTPPPSLSKLPRDGQKQPEGFSKAELNNEGNHATMKETTN